MIIENLSTLKIHKLTQEQYDRDLERETHEALKFSDKLKAKVQIRAEANYNANPPEGAPSTWAELIATRSNWTIAYA